jgi:hypothetical protein
MMRVIVAAIGDEQSSAARVSIATPYLAPFPARGSINDPSNFAAAACRARLRRGNFHAIHRGIARARATRIAGAIANFNGRPSYRATITRLSRTGDAITRVNYFLNVWMRIDIRGR